MKPQYINSWKAWKSFAEHHNFDPYKQLDFSIDYGGGNSIDWEYTGDVPEKED